MNYSFNLEIFNSFNVKTNHLQLDLSNYQISINNYNKISSQF